MSLFKKLGLAIAVAAVSCSSAFAAATLDTPPTAQATNPNTLLIACAFAAYPGGVACGSPTSLGATYTAAQADAALTGPLGCSALGGGIYTCGANAALPGIFALYQWADGTTEVSRIIYIAR